MLAVGYDSGTVLLRGVDDGRLIHQLKLGDCPITSLVWVEETADTAQVHRCIYSVHVNIHVLHIHIHTCTYICMYTYLCMYMYMYMYIYMLLCIYIDMMLC